MTLYATEYSGSFSYNLNNIYWESGAHNILLLQKDGSCALFASTSMNPGLLTLGY